MATIRQKMMELLRKEELDAHDLSQILSRREKEVYEHLPHIVKSLEAVGEKLTVHPYVCQTCEYVFRDRSRLNRPGKCPRCKEGAIRMATYEIIS